MATQANIQAGLVRHAEDGLPVRLRVKVGANVAFGMGELVFVNLGFGVRPAAANAATAKCAGTALQNVDNTGGADGDITVDVEDGWKDFKNDGTHPCSQTDVEKTVFASDKQTISNNSGDGPPAGVLKYFNSADQEPGRPCRVHLKVSAG